LILDLGQENPLYSPVTGIKKIRRPRVLNCQDIVSLTRELVAIPSESSDPVATPAAAEAGVLAALTAACDRAGLAWQTQEALPGRHNLVIRLPNPGKPRVVILAHQDTVSGRGMTAPFSGELRDGKIYGRGSCDDKGPLAAALATVIAAYQSGRPLACDLVFAATVDEECTMAGAVRLAKELTGWDLCLGLEPTGLRMIHAHKGAYRFRLTSRGVAAHSSEPANGKNAIHLMLPVLDDLRRYGRELAVAHDPELGNATLAITQLTAGSSPNIIPDLCTAGVDIRLLPDMEPNAITPAVRALVGRRAEVEEVYQGRGIHTDLANPLIRRLQEILVDEGHDPASTTAAFATDCAKLAHKGPCIVWGPGHIAQAHKPEEYIEISQLEAAGRMLCRFLTGD